MGEVIQFSAGEEDVYILSCPECGGVNWRVRLVKENWKTARDFEGLVCTHCEWFVLFKELEE